MSESALFGDDFSLVGGSGAWSPPPEPATVEASGPDLAALNMRLIPATVSQAEVIHLTGQLAIMVDAGITLSVALEGIAEQETNPALKELLIDLKSDVESGEDFSSALARYPHYFDETYLAMVRASEQTGSLAEMLEQIAGYLNKEQETRGKVLASLTYPGIMLGMAIAVTIFLLTYILPKFEPLFARKSLELPTPTLWMMAASDSLLHFWWAWLLGIGAAAVGGYFGSRTEWGRQALDWMKIHVPVLGPMFRKVAISRSVRTLGTMTAAGVAVLDALELSGQVCGNWHFEQVWRRVRAHVTEGQTIQSVLQESELFPPTLVQMIAAGEETGRLDFVLAKVSDHYDQEVELGLKSAVALIEPVMIAVMGVIVGGIGLSLLLPIFSLSTSH